MGPQIPGMEEILIDPILKNTIKPMLGKCKSIPDDISVLNYLGTRDDLASITNHFN